MTDNGIVKKSGGVQLSIVVPVYNAERYIKDCLDSLLDQGMDYSDYEIICVNDGSKDNSLTYLKEYEAKYSNVIVIDQTNSGQSHARNVGLESAKGKYLWFVDSDDIVHPHIVSEFLPKIEKEDFDLIMFNYERVSSEFRFINVIDTLDNDEDCSVLRSSVDSVHPYRTDKKEHFDACWGVFIKRDLLIAHNITFNEKMSGAEDVVWFYQIKKVVKSDSVGYIDKCFYYYRTHPDSITHKKTDEGTKKYQSSLKELTAFWRDELVLGEDVKDRYDHAVAQCTYMLLSVSDKQWVKSERKSLSEAGFYPPKLNLKLIKTNNGMRQFVIDLIRSALHFKILFWPIWFVYGFIGR